MPRVACGTFQRQVTLRKSRRIEQKTACEIVEISDDDESESLSFRRFMKSVTEELERINDNEGKDSIYNLLLQFKKKKNRNTFTDESMSSSKFHRRMMID